MDRELVELLEKQTQILEQLAYAGMSAEEKAAAVGATGPGTLFGGGGVFAVPGLEPDVITAYVRPHGLLEKLPRFPSVFEQPRFGTITGFTATTGVEAVNPCDDNPAGYMKGCNLTAQFGRIARDTQTIEWDKTIRQLHAGITTELALRGRVLGLGDVSPAGLSEADILNIYTMGEMVTVGVNIERLLNVHLWQGNPANNTANSGYMEFPGLSRQVATGQVDADTGLACAALDSDVKSFNYNSVCGTNPSIVRYLSMLEYYLRMNSLGMGLDPVSWVIVMRDQLWFPLSECWPCQYNTNRCAGAAIGAGGASQTVLLGDEMTAIRDRMRRSMTIDINGTTYPVVTDTGIFEHNNVNNANLLPGQYASTIYMIPLTIIGNFPTTYMEHVDYTRGARDRALLRGMEDFWTDRGLYSWALEQVKWCYKLSVKTEQRVVLRTPHLAGRIDAVMYEPLQHLREPFADSPYFADGGVSIRGTPSTYHVW